MTHVIPMHNKKQYSIIKVLMILVLFTSQLSYAGYIGPSGVQNLQSIQETIKYAMDSTYVQLEGRLIRQLNHDTYILQDQTGQIHVEIDQRLIYNMHLNEHTIIQIKGEFEKDFLERPEIDVDSLVIVTPTPNK